jgi:hypothetical protein
MSKTTATAETNLVATTRSGLARRSAKRIGPDEGCVDLVDMAD